MRFVVIAPARRESARLADKMLADIGGLPMIVRTLQKAGESGAARVLAACDDDEVLQVCRAAGYEAVMTGEHQSGSSRIAEAASIAGIDDDCIVVNVQGDEPFIEPAVINKTAALLHQREDCVCATAMRKLHDGDYDNHAVVKVVADNDGCALYFSRSPIPAAKDKDNAAASLAIARAHIGIYAFRPAFLRGLPKLQPSPLEEVESLEQLRILWHGKKIALVEVASTSFGIDTAEDLARARRIIKQQQ